LICSTAILGDQAGKIRRIELDADVNADTDAGEGHVWLAVPN